MTHTHRHMNYGFPGKGLRYARKIRRINNQIHLDNEYKQADLINCIDAWDRRYTSDNTISHQFNADATRLSYVTESNSSHLCPAIPNKHKLYYTRTRHGDLEHHKYHGQMWFDYTYEDHHTDLLCSDTSIWITSSGRAVIDHLRFQSSRLH